MKKSLFPIFSIVAFMSLGVSVSLKDDKQLFNVEKVEAETSIAAYYRTVNGNGEDLLNSITSRIRNGYTAKTYDDLWTGYSNVYKMSNGKMYDIYSDNTNFAVSKKCGSYSNIGDCYNREHTIPKSWWGGAQKGQGADIIIVVPSDGKINGMRSNMPYGETTTGKTYSANGDPSGNRVGNSTSTQYVTGEVFEPFDDRKGDIARIYFYAATMYKNTGEDAGKVTNWTSGDGSKVFSEDGKFGFKQSYLDMLLKWHNEDPVSENEIAWNSKFEDFQGNRNPYIDHPSWVDLIWGGTYASTNKNAENTKNGTASVSSGSLGGYIDEGGGNITLDVTPNNATLNVNDELNVSASLSGATGTIIWYQYSDDGGYVNMSATTGNSITVTGVSAGTVELHACFGDVDTFATINVVGTGEETEQTLTITYQNCGSTGYVANQSTKINGIDFAYSNVSNTYKPSKLQFNKYTGVIYNVTPLTYIKSVKITSNDATYNFNGTIGFSETTAGAETNVATVNGTQTFDVSGKGYRFFSIFAGPAVGYIDSIEVTYFAGEQVIKTLSHIEVSGMTTQYYVGDEFTFDGTLTAFFNTGEEEELEPTSVSSPNMSTVGDKEVTVSLTCEEVTKEAKYNIHVSERVIHVESISLNVEGDTIELEEGAQFGIEVTFVPSDASDKSLAYESDDENIATINSEGVVTAIREGSALISVKSLDNEDAWELFEVLVYKHEDPVINVTSVYLDTDSKDLYIGETFTLGYEVLPIDATNKNVSWESNDEAIATVENGFVTAVGEGTATISVITEDGNKIDNCTVRVSKAPNPATGLSLDKTEVELDLNGDTTATLVATITPVDADEQELTFISSDASVCEVTNEGVLTAKAVGDATITVSLEGTSLTATCEVSVKDTTPPPPPPVVHVTGVSLNETAIELHLGESFNLVATINPDDADDKRIVWSTSQGNVAQVNQEGKITARGRGTAIITVTTVDGGFTATCEVTVTRKQEEEPTKPSASSLCGGNVIASSVILTLLSATFIVIIRLVKKKHEN